MQKKFTLAIVIIMFIPFIMKAEWVPLNNKNAKQAPPNVTLISDDNSSTVLNIEISGFDLKDLNADGHEYQIADLLTESFITQPGLPELPYIAKVLAIPDQASISFEIIETGDVQTFQNISLPPARTSWKEGDPETPYVENMKAYALDKSFPNDYVKIESPSIFRDFRIARISVFPMRYIPANKELQVVSSITIRINYGAGEIINPKTTSKKPIAPSFADMYRSFIFNYQSVLDDSYGGKENGHELMLCIMPDEFATSFQTYADWKRQSGIDIHITKFSDIGANATDPDIIKTHIADAYHNWDVPPTYVLIVGDDGIFPKKIVSYDYSFPNEDFFVEIDGDDYFPEMMIGRFTNQSDYTMQVMMNKFIKYEKTPYTADTDWFKKGICCSNDAYDSQVETKRFAAERMLVDGGFTSVDTMMNSYPCNYDLNDVIGAINEGRSYLNYRGEGWSSGWWASCTQFGTSDVSNLNNGQKFTFVTSIGCGVAMFSTGGGNCFGEEWLELGTISSPKGAAAFVGPTSNTHTTYNNKLDKGIYVGMFQEGMDTPGQGLLRGKLYMYNVFGNEYWVEYHYRVFCILGDPSIHVWKDVPQAITVNYPATVPFGSNLVEFTVNHTSSGQAVENAVVCVTGDNFFATGNTDALGIAYLDIAGDDLETLTVTVRGGNVIPFQGTMDLIPPNGPWVIADSFSLNDVTGGNGNSLMDYDESILLTLEIKNAGPAQANNVNVTLTTTEPFITITDNLHNCGNIAAGQTIIATDGFAFTVADNIPDEHEVFIHVVATDGVDSWNSNLSIIGHAPVLSLGIITIFDPTGNYNGLLDPGETADIIIEATNSGHSISPDATAYLSSTSSWITLNTSTDNLGPIDIGTVEASYSVSVSPSVPVGESIELDFDLVSGNYSTSKSTTASIGLMIEDWETGDFNKYPWTMGGDAAWTMITDNPYEGLYSARSGDINDSQISDMEVTIYVSTEGHMSFYRQVSSENNYDFLRFFIDGSLQDEWSGTVNWGEVSFPVTVGTHTFKWQYYKDFSESSGSDCAWIDYIVFPYPSPPVMPPYQTGFEDMGNTPDGWLNDSGDDFDWTILSGPTPSNNTGPSGDHTSGSGYYMYTEATNPNNPYKRADMITPTLNLTLLDDVEVRFWYHMWDNTTNSYMGTLHVDVFHNNIWIEDVMTPISGGQGDQWHEQVVDLSTYAGEVIVLRFRGITGSGYASDICIDDFSIDGTLSAPFANIELTALLEGPFKESDMSTDLNEPGCIPLSQPYNTTPWNYTGDEAVVSIPNADVVDWALVELRETTGDATSATPGTMIAQKAGFILKNGNIVNLDGHSSLTFDVAVSNNLYALVYHRNHVAVMSANAITLTDDVYIYDFSTASGQAYGTNPQKQLAPGKWGMMSGDCDANGTVGIEDIEPDWTTNAGKEGYTPIDLNLDRQVDNKDKDSYWLPNLGTGSYIPE